MVCVEHIPDTKKIIMRVGTQHAGARYEIPFRVRPQKKQSSRTRPGTPHFWRNWHLICSHDSRGLVAGLAIARASSIQDAIMRYTSHVIACAASHRMKSVTKKKKKIYIYIYIYIYRYICSALSRDS